MRLLILIAIIWLSLSCPTPAAQTDKPIDELLPPWQLLQEPEYWQRFRQPTDFDDQREYDRASEGDLIESGDARASGAQVVLANNLAASGHFDEAIEKMSGAIAGQNASKLQYRWRVSRAKLYLLVGQKDKALDDLRAAATQGNLGMVVGLEVEKSLVALKEYQLAIDTIPGYLAQVPKSIQVSAGAFEYLLGDCYQNTGDYPRAIDQYSQAARCFMTERAFGAGNACLSHIRAIVAEHHLNAPVLDELAGLEAAFTGVPELQQMVKDLASSPDCLDPSFVSKAARVTMNEIKPGSYQSAVIKCLDSSAVSPLTGIRRISIAKVSDKGDWLTITMAPTDLPLHTTDIAGILHSSKPVPGYDRGGDRGWPSQGYRVPSGTLVVCHDQGDPTLITCLVVVAQTPSERLAEQTMHQQNIRQVIYSNIAFFSTKQALSITEDWVRQQPDDVKAHFMRAQALALAARYKDAIKEIDCVLDSKDSNKAKLRVTGLSRGNVPLILKGTYQTGLGQYAAALQTFKQGFPDQSQPHTDAALPIFRRRLPDEPQLDTDDYYYRAQAEIGANRLQDACDDLNTAVTKYFDQGRIVRRDHAKALLEHVRSKLN